jgi:type IV pilus assembly protein PilA
MGIKSQIGGFMFGVGKPERLVPGREGGNPVLLILLVVGCFAGMASVGTLAAVVVPQLSTYRVKAYNSAAMSDLKSAKTALKSYAASHHNTYPAAFGGAIITPSDGVELQYEKKGQSGYVLTSTHKDGDRFYQTASDSDAILWKSKKDITSKYASL